MTQDKGGPAVPRRPLPRGRGGPRRRPALPGGRIAPLTSSCLADRKRIDLLGDRGVATRDPLTDDTGSRLSTASAEATDARQGGFVAQVPFGREIDLLSCAILEGFDAPTPGEMRLHDVRMSETVYRSSAVSGPGTGLNADGTARGLT